MTPPPYAPLVILFAAVFSENMLLGNFLGMCSFLSVSRELKTALGLGVAVTFVMTLTCAINWLVNHYILIPLDLEYLQLVTFIVLVAATVQLVEMVIERASPALYMALGIFLPLITVNCAVLGACLFMVIRRYTLVQSVTYGFGGGLGWLMAIAAMGAIRQKLMESRVPKPLQGPGISLIIAGVMALAFIGFSGMASIR